MRTGSRLRPGVYAITPGDAPDFAQIMRTTAGLLKAGISALQYRDKSAAAVDKIARATALRSMCRDAGVPFIVNDDPALAAETGADGVHLGADDPSPALARALLGRDALVGVSCYDDVDLAVGLAAREADYAAFGAFFPTGTKSPRARATLDTLRAARARLTTNIVAIGGITPENCAALLGAGADVLAVVSSLYHAADPAQQVRRFQDEFRRHQDLQE